MRTKLYLAALCLPLAFTACTNEDLVNETPLKALESRGKIEVTLNADRSAFSDPNTRMSIDADNKFVWEKDLDMIGAALVDGGTAGQVGDNVLVNYPFTANNTASVSSFSSKSSITEGLYFFYYGYQDVLDRKALALNMPEQTFDAAGEKTAIQQAASYMKMVSPIVNLADGVTYADAQAYDLSLSFANLYTMVKVNIYSSNFPAGVSPSVTKVTLNGKATPFVQKANADLVTIGGTLNANVLNLDDKGQVDKTKQAKALAELNKLIDAGTVYSTTDKTTGPSELKVSGTFALSEGADAAKSLYILAPKGTNADLVLTVETSEGTYTREISDEVVFSDKISVLKADLNFAQDGTGNVILPTDFSIASSSDWKNAVDFLTAHSVGYINKTIAFNLTEDVEIASLPTFKLTISGNQTLTLTKDYTINENNKDQFKVTNTKLGIAKGATLNVNSATVTFESIENYGTVNVTKDLSTAIANFGTLNINDDVTASEGITNGRIKAGDTGEATGAIAIAKDKKLTITTVALNSVVGSLNVATGAKLINNFASTNAAKSTITNNGTIEGSAAITNKGKIDNFGVLKCAITNDKGNFIIEKGSKSNGSSTITSGTVEVMDVTTFTALQATADKYSFTTATVTTSVTNVKEYESADVVAAGITNITLNGGDWILASAKGTDTSKTIVVPVNAGGLTLKAANLALTTVLAGKAIIADGGACSITAEAAQSITRASVTVNAGASLSIGNSITVNALTTAGVGATIATINGNLTVNAGAKMYFNTATVGANVRLVVSGNTATIIAPAEFGVNGELTNSGLVQSAAGTASVKAAGKVSQPVNAASGTFQGNATAFTFS